MNRAERQQVEAEIVRMGRQYIPGPGFKSFPYLDLKFTEDPENGFQFEWIDRSEWYRIDKDNYSYFLFRIGFNGNECYEMAYTHWGEFTVKFHTVLTVLTLGKERRYELIDKERKAIVAAGHTI